MSCHPLREVPTGSSRAFSRLVVHSWSPASAPPCPRLVPPCHLRRPTVDRPHPAPCPFGRCGAQLPALLVPPVEDRSTPASVKPFRVTLVEPVAYPSVQLWYPWNSTNCCRNPA